MRHSKKIQMQDARNFRNEAYIVVRRMTKVEAQRSRWTFYEVAMTERFKSATTSTNSRPDPEASR